MIIQRYLDTEWDLLLRNPLDEEVRALDDRLELTSVRIVVGELKCESGESEHVEHLFDVDVDLGDVEQKNHLIIQSKARHNGDDRANSR